MLSGILISSEGELENRVLVAAPAARDRDVLRLLIDAAGIEAVACPDIESLCRELKAGAAAAIVAEEYLVRRSLELLAGTFRDEPEWSDLPLIVMAGSGEMSDHGWKLLDEMSGSCHTIMLQRPVRKVTLMSTVRAALRSRERQYQVRAELLRRKQAEQEVMQARDELEQRVAERTAELRQRANQLGKLSAELTLAEQRERRRLAHVLHDHLQQILVGARISLDLLRKRVGPGEKHSVEQVLGLIEEAMKSSRSLTVELSPPILHEARLAVGLQWLARWMEDKHRLKVNLEIDERAQTDREDLRILMFQAVRELLFNVVKHAGVAEAFVTVEVDEREQLRVTVTDNGRGFESLPELDDDGGFGLFNIRERLSLLGGGLVAEGNPGRGARFVLVVPLKTGDAKTKATQSDESFVGKQVRAEISRQQDPAKGNRIRVLLVDDHEVMREGLGMLIGSDPEMEVIGEASDGMEAIEAVQRLRPDIVLMDFSMPRMNGAEATRRICSDYPAIHVIGLSMYEEPHRAEAMMKAGAAGYLNKSDESSVLLERIRAVHQSAPADR